MKSSDLILQQEGTPAAIVRQLIANASKVYVAQDVGKAVDIAIARFYQQMRDAAQQEMKFTKMKKMPGKTGI
jgi:hypothetical protein